MNPSSRAPTTNSRSMPVEEFLQSLTNQLDRAQDGLALKMKSGRPLTWALKDLTLDLRVFVEMDAQGRVLMRSAGPNEESASTLHINLTTITRPMVEENTFDMDADGDPRSIDRIRGAANFDDEDQRRLDRLGIRTVGQLKRLSEGSNPAAVESYTGIPVDRLRMALEAASRPSVTGQELVARGDNSLLRIHGANLADGISTEVRLAGEPVEVLEARPNMLLVRPLNHHQEGAIEVHVSGQKANGYFRLGARRPPEGDAMSGVATARPLPWRPEAARKVVYGAVTLRLKDRSEHLPTQAAVRLGHTEAGLRVDDGPIDRELRRHSAAHLATCAFGAARHVGAPEYAHQGWDAVEDEIGLSRTVRVRFDPTASLLALLDALRALDGVEAASPDYLCDTPFAVPAHSGAADALPASWKLIGADRALALEPGDPALIVAVIDSGASLGHPELAGRLRSGADTVDLPADHLSHTLKLLGDYSGRDHTPVDEQGHGTACAGIIAARGEHVPRGLAGAASVLPIRALAAARGDAGNITAVGSISDIDAAFKLAVDLGARVLNLSFGTPKSALREDDPVPHTELVQYALARGCVLVAASGNAGDEVPYYPAALPGVIAVGAVDDRGVACPFTSRGPHVALSAPGSRLRTLSLDGYHTVSGTSFAAPFVSAACALLVAAAQRRATPLDPLDVRRLLMESAAAFPSGTPAGMGAGILDVPAALQRLALELDREVA